MNICTLNIQFYKNITYIYIYIHTQFNDSIKIMDHLNTSLPHPEKKPENIYVRWY